MVGRIGELVGTGEVQEISKKRQKVESKMRVVTGEDMKSILTDIKFLSFSYLTENPPIKFLCNVRDQEHQ